MSLFETIVGAAINGIGTGVGVSIGIFFVNKYFLNHVEKFETKIKTDHQTVVDKVRRQMDSWFYLDQTGRRK